MKKNILLAFILSSIFLLSIIATIIYQRNKYYQSKKILNSGPNYSRVLPSSTPIPTLSILNSTSDWQDYYNDDYHFVFNYPSFWKINIDPTSNPTNSVILAESLDKCFSINLAITSNINNSLIDYLIQEGNLSKNLIYSNSKIGRKDTIKIKNSEYIDRNIYYVKNNDDIYEFSIIDNGINKNNKNLTPNQSCAQEQNYDLILSRFKFVSFVNPNWKNYLKDDVFPLDHPYKGFSVSFPSNCVLSTEDVDTYLNCSLKTGSAKIRLAAPGQDGVFSSTLGQIADKTKNIPAGEGDFGATWNNWGNFWINKTPLLTKNYIFGFEYQLTGTKNSTEFDILFNQILSTFKFTNSQSTSDTSNWKSYTSALYKVEFKYPKNWVTITDNYSGSAISLIKRVNPIVVISDKAQEGTCGPYLCYSNIKLLYVKNIDNIIGKEWLEKFYITNNYVSSKVTFDSMDIKEMYVGNQLTIREDNNVFIFKGKDVFIFEVGLANNRNNTNYDTVLNQILSTFKFTN